MVFRRRPVRGHRRMTERRPVSHSRRRKRTGLLRQANSMLALGNGRPVAARSSATPAGCLRTAGTTGLHRRSPAALAWRALGASLEFSDHCVIASSGLLVDVCRRFLDGADDSLRGLQCFERVDLDGVGLGFGGPMQCVSVLVGNDRRQELQRVLVAASRAEIALPFGVDVDPR